MITQQDFVYLNRAIELAQIALDLGDEPFGSLLVSADQKVLFEDHNRVSGGDHTKHPEFAIAKWAAEHMTVEERSQATVYTSGEHCPMCAAAHGWNGLGRIVYVSSSQQLAQWLEEFGVAPSRVRNLPIDEVIRDTIVEGPIAELAAKVKEMHRLFHAN